MVKSNERSRDGRGLREGSEAQEFQGIDFRLGDYIKHYGNIAGYLYSSGDTYGPLIVFPVKHHWKLKADLGLITESAGILRELATDKPERTFDFSPFGQAAGTASSSGMKYGPCS